MSQSDYIKYKKMSTELKRMNKLEPILESNQYISYKNYALENKIQNTKITYNQLLLPNRTQIFNMEKKVTDCPVFTTCLNTNLRANRKLHTQIPVHPIRPLFQKNNKKCDCTQKIFH